MSSSQLPATGLVPDLVIGASVPRKTEILLIPSFGGVVDPEDPILADLIDTSAVSDALRTLRGEPAPGDVVRIPSAGLRAEDAPGFRIMILELGERSELDDTALRRRVGAAARGLAAEAATAPHRLRVATTLGSLGLEPVVEGLLLGSYRYEGLRGERSRTAKITLVQPEEDRGELKRRFTRARDVAGAVLFARDLVNTPANLLYPGAYAKLLRKRAGKLGVNCEVLGGKELRKAGYGGVLSVGHGSDHGPRLVRLEWRPEGARRTVALVGKGITFDTGGISLKPANDMWDMISDMGGSAAMAATVLAAARLELPVAVTATLPLAENMPGGEATRPGDVITHYGGITSEVLNTDAEGRLVLADALVRAAEDEPDLLIDAATLTGAQMVALGGRVSAVMGDAAPRERLARLGQETDEPIWPMPLVEEHAEALKSPVADVRNIHRSRNAGMLFAGAYLRRFVPASIPWAHLDIAGPAFNTEGAHGFTPERATGVPVRTLLALLAEIAAGDDAAVGGAGTVGTAEEEPDGES